MLGVWICKHFKNPMDPWLETRPSWPKSFIHHHKLKKSCHWMSWHQIRHNRKIKIENRALRPLFLHQHYNSSLRFKLTNKYWTLHPITNSINCIFRYSNGTRTIQEDMKMSQLTDRTVVEIVKIQTIFIHNHFNSFIIKIVLNNKSTTQTLNYFHLWLTLSYQLLRP